MILIMNVETQPVYTKTNHYQEWDVNANLFILSQEHASILTNTSPLSKSRPNKQIFFQMY